MRPLVLASLLILGALPAFAQSPSPAPERERRPQSEAQQRNIRIMRECGAEWRAAKEAGTVQGTTWRAFLGTCRSRKMV